MAAHFDQARKAERFPTLNTVEFPPLPIKKGSGKKQLEVGLEAFKGSVRKTKNVWQKVDNTESIDEAALAKAKKNSRKREHAKKNAAKEAQWKLLAEGSGPLVKQSEQERMKFNSAPEEDWTLVTYKNVARNRGAFKVSR